ncbi:MAG TPA: radical SAM protein [Terriglobales bacterium]|nr:radical SAM protein [Terriglobales bacterium]
MNAHAENPYLFYAEAADEAPTPLVGIARLAAEGESVRTGHNVEYFTLEARSILNRCTAPRMPFTWTINPYRGCEFACKYCYARYTHEFMEIRDSVEFERQIYIKQGSCPTPVGNVNLENSPTPSPTDGDKGRAQNPAPSSKDEGRAQARPGENLRYLLRRDLKKVKPGEEIAIGTATDPYQPAERRYEVTRTLLEEFALHRGFDIGIVTKSDLIVRDIDVLRRVAKNNRLFVNITITTLDPQLARILEPRAPRPDLRLKALRVLNLSGIDAGVICAPVLPGITDKPRDLEQLVKETARHGGKYIFANPLFLKPCSASVFVPFLEKEFPQLVGEYKKRFEGKAFVSAPYRKRISELMAKLRSKYGITHHFARKKESGPQLVEAQQMALFQEPEKRGPAAHAGMERRRRTMC